MDAKLIVEMEGKKTRLHALKVNVCLLFSQYLYLNIVCR